MRRMEVPHLSLLVLDGLSDDIETAETQRDHGHMAPDGLALVDERDLLRALRVLLYTAGDSAARQCRPSCVRRLLLISLLCLFALGTPAHATTALDRHG